MDTVQKNEKVSVAIKAHFAWFDRLKSAITDGKSEFKPETVRVDNNCEFGKWVYSDLRKICPDEKTFTELKDIHAEFHQKAGEILAMALRGEKDAAAKEIIAGSRLYALSGKLVLILRRL